MLHRKIILLYLFKNQKFTWNQSFLIIENILLISWILGFLYRTNIYHILDQFSHYLDQLILVVIEWISVLIYSNAITYFLNFFSNVVLSSWLCFGSSTASSSSPLKYQVSYFRATNHPFNFIAELSFRNISTHPYQFSLVYCSVHARGQWWYLRMVLLTVNILSINSVYTSGCFNCKSFQSLMKTGNHLHSRNCPMKHPWCDLL